MPRLKFKPGDSLQWAGDAEMQGMTDWTGYALTAHFRVRERAGRRPAARLHSQPVTFVTRTGIASVLMTVPANVTASWPYGETIVVDVVLTDAAGVTVTSDSYEMQTEPRA